MYLQHCFIRYQMQPKTKSNEEKEAESLPAGYINKKDKCKGTYYFPSAIVYDFDSCVLIKDEFDDIYRLSTIYGNYCCTFPFLFLSKYRNLFFEHIKYASVLEAMHAPPFTI